jgi:VanZ family protein
MKRKRVWRIVSVALIVVWAVVIFSFSAQPDTESSEISGHVSYRIVKMWKAISVVKEKIN